MTRSLHALAAGVLAALALMLAWLALAASPAGAAYVFERKWGTQGSGNGQFNHPRSVAVTSGADVYVVDAHNFRVQLFDSSGSFVTKWGSGGSGDREFAGPVGPWGVAADDDGRVYVADYDNDRVQRFSRFGDFLTKWGSGGSGDGRFDNPQGVAIGLLDSVFVTDRGNDRVQKFSLSGDFIDKWGSEGTANGQFNVPEGVAVNSLAPFALGEVYVTDAGNDRVQKFSRFGTFLRKWGTEGSGNGQFSYPRGVAVDSHGDVYVADALNHRIQKFDSSGTFITKWGTQGSGDGRFRLPTGVAVDAQGNVYVADRDNHRIQKFRVVLPQTSLIAPPADPTSDPAPTFRFSSSRPGSSFECRMDAGSAFPCTSPHRFFGLAEGEHTFRVRATDGAGHTDATPAEWSFTVDTEVTIEINGKRMKLNGTRKGAVQLLCPASELSGPCAGELKLKTRRKVSFRGKRRRLILAKRDYSIPEGEAKAVKLRLGKRKARLVRNKPGARKARTIVRVGDGAGNSARVASGLTVTP